MTRLRNVGFVADPFHQDRCVVELRERRRPTEADP
jgi:hypothetical protein